MPFRDLANHSGILQDRFNVVDHVPNIASFLEEAKPALERYCTNHIEGVPLQPDSKIDRLALEVSHSVDKDASAFFCERLHCFDRRHREFLGYRPFQRRVVRWIPGREHAGHKGIVVERGHGVVKACFEVIVVDPIDDWHGVWICQRHGIWTGADDGAVLVV